MKYLNNQNSIKHWARKVWRVGGRVFVVNVGLVTIIVGLFVGYLVLNNQTTESGFTVRELEKKISVLRDEGNTLRLKVVAMQAMGSVEEEVSKLGFVPVSKFDYISAAPELVAIK